APMLRRRPAAAREQEHVLLAGLRRALTVERGIDDTLELSNRDLARASRRHIVFDLRLVVIRLLAVARARLGVAEEVVAHEPSDHPARRALPLAGVVRRLLQRFPRLVDLLLLSRLPLQLRLRLP